MVKPNFTTLAKRYEIDGAYARKRNPIDHGVVMTSYEKAGDYWEKTGDIRNAIKDYEDAIRYAHTKEDKDRIKVKINELQFTRTKMLARLGEMKRGLEDKLYLFITAIAFFIISLFFSFVSITGNAIAIFNSGDFRWVGLCLFLFGLIFTLLYFKKFQKNEK